MTTKLLGTAALALLVGVGVSAIDIAAAQNGSEARSNDRALQKTLDDRELTPIRPIRRVGPDSWPAAKDPRPTNLPPETTGQSASNDEDSKQEDAKQDDTKRNAAQQDTKPAQSGAAQQDQAAPKQDSARDETAAKDTATKDEDKGFASIRLGTDKQGRVAVNDAQERQITKVLRKHGGKTFDVDVRVGVVAPAEVRLGAVPADIVEVLPQFRGYRFFATRTDIAIVEPDSKKIVALVPVKLTATASKPREERTTRSETTTTRKAARKPARKDRDVTVGRGVPSEAEIVAAPVVGAPAGTVVTRTYRYRVEEPETVIIERRRPRLFGLW
jgi:hypothetical protein